MTKEKCLTGVFTAGGLMLIFTMFANYLNMVNTYDSHVDNNSHVVSAFNG